MDILRSLLDANPNIYLVGLVLIVAIVVKSFVGQSGKGQGIIIRSITILSFRLS